MPIPAQCPSCKTKCVLPEDHAGKAFRCKKCREAFRLQAPPDGQGAAVAVAVASSPAARPKSIHSEPPAGPPEVSPPLRVKAVPSRNAPAHGSGKPGGKQGSVPDVSLKRGQRRYAL